MANWLNAVTGSWTDPTQWSSNPLFPNNGNGGANYNVTITATGSAYNVNLGSTITVDGLTVGSAAATLNDTGGTLTALSGITLSAGTLNLNGGTIANTTINVTGGSLVIAANQGNLLNAVTVNGDIMLSGTSSVTKIDGGTTFNNAHLAAASTDLSFAPNQTLGGSILFEGSAAGTRNVEMNGFNGTFTVGSTGAIRTTAGFGGSAQIGTGFNFSGNMTLVNQGTISSEVAGHGITIGATSFTNSSGAVTQAINGGTLTINSPTWSNAGNINVTGGSSATFNGTWSNTSGTVTVDATSNLTFGGNFTTPGLGTLHLTSGSVVTITGTWDNSGQSYTLNSATGSWTLNGGTISGGTLNYGNGQSLLLSTNSSNLITGVAINGDLNLSGSGNVAKIGGSTSFVTAHMSGSSTDLGFVPGYSLTGTIQFEGAGTGLRNLEMNGTDGTFTVGSGGVLRAASGFAGTAQIGTPFNYGGAMTLINQGLISNEASGRTMTINTAGFTNTATGVTQATGGSILTINATNWSNVGNINVTGGSSATFNGTWSNTSGTVTVDATSSLIFGGNFTTLGLGTLNLSSGSNVSVTGTWDNSGQTYTLNNATGSWTLNGGTISGGTLNYGNGQSLLVSNSSANLITGVTINGDLNLNGVGNVLKIGGTTSFVTAHLAANSTDLGFVPGHSLTGSIQFEGSGTGVRNLEMNGTDGTFTVGSGGSIRAVSGFGGTAQIGTPFNYGGAMTLINQGLISNEASGRTMNISTAGFTNMATGATQATGGSILVINATTWSNVGNINVTGGSSAAFNGTWSNTGGTVTVDATSSLSFGGNFTTLGLGILNLSSGSNISVTGKWDNSNQTYTLNNATGSWTLNGGTLSGGTLNYGNGQSLLVSTNTANLITNVTINGDLNLNGSGNVVKIGGTTSFVTAHLGGASADLGFVPGYSLTGTIQFEGSGAGLRSLEMNGTDGTFTVGSGGVLRAVSGFGGTTQIGVPFSYGGAMTLINQGLISNEASGRTMNISTAGFTNMATGVTQATGGSILTINATNWSNAGNINVTGDSTATFNGSWSNTGGTVTVDATSTLNLGGTFSTAGLGTLNTTAGSAVNVTGAWDNTSQTYSLNSNSGAWTLSGGSLTGGTLGLTGGQSLFIGPATTNVISGVTVGGDLSFTVANAITKIGPGTTFGTAHLIGNSSSIAFAPGMTMNGTISFEGADPGVRSVGMNGTSGTLTIGPSGVVQTAAGFAGSAQIGPALIYGGVMTLTNQGLISNQVTGRTITVNPGTFTNAGTIEAVNGGIVQIPAGYTQTAGVTRVNGGTIGVSTSPTINTISIVSGRLEGNGTITGNVNVADTISASLAAAPSTGTLAINGDLSLGSAAKLQIEIGGTTQGTQYDLLTEAGTTPLTLQGTLSVSLIDGFVPAFTDTFTIVGSNQAIAGMFGNVSGGRVINADGKSSFVVGVNGNQVVLSAFLVPEPGTVSLLAVGLGSLCRWRCRRRPVAGDAR